MPKPLATYCLILPWNEFLESAFDQQLVFHFYVMTAHVENRNFDSVNKGEKK
jgi:hypothetical protein